MMRKILKTTFVLMFVTLSVFAFSTRTKPEFSAGNAVLGEPAESPKTLYLRNCARCHGADGKSQTELGQTLDATDLTTHKTSVSRGIRVITRGMGGMPGFGKK